MRGIKIIGFSLIICINILAVTLIALVGLEITLKNPEKKYIYLYQTEYYKTPQKGNPYWSFAIQRIHPYYIFSLPWKKKQIDSINNSVASLAEDGFRKIHIKDQVDKKIVFLGGRLLLGMLQQVMKRQLGRCSIIYYLFKL